LKFKAVFSC